MQKLDHGRATFISEFSVFAYNIYKFEPTSTNNWRFSKSQRVSSKNACLQRWTKSKVEQLTTLFYNLPYMLIKLYLITLPVFFAIDMLWLWLVAKNFYREQIGSLLRTEFNWAAAILFYLIFIFGLVIFVIQPAVEKQSAMHALIYGALFGGISYATYDLTNLATLKGWTLLVTAVDMTWGVVLWALVSYVAYSIAIKFFVWTM